MKRFVLVWMCLLVLVSCKDDVSHVLSQQEMGEVVAQVGDKKFYEADIDFEIMSMPESMRHMMQDELARGQVLEVMIKREVVAQKARDMGLNLDPLIAYRMRQAENTVLIQSIRDWQHDAVQKPTLEEAKAYYEKHLERFIIPEQVHARHILVSDKQTALEILKQLRADPESFATLAAQYSIDDSNKGRGGDLNWFAKGVMVKPFEEAVFALNEKNRLSKPVQTQFGWHVIEWLGSKAQSTPAFEDVQLEIISILEKQKLEAWIDKLMDETNIEVVKPEYHVQG